MKKIVAVLTVLCIAISLVACGKKTYDNNGTTDTQESVLESEFISETDAHEGETLILGGFYKSNTSNEFYIYDENGLKNFNKVANSTLTAYSGEYFKNSTVILKADIDADLNWIPICSDEKFIDTTIDGNGHYISGLKYSSTGKTIEGNAPLGFFGWVSTNVCIKNLTLKNITTVSKEHGKWVGAIVGYHKMGNLKISNVVVDGASFSFSTESPNQTSSTAKKIGGIIGFSWDMNGLYSSDRYSLTIENCTIKNSTFSGNVSVSGIGGSIFNYMNDLYSEHIKITGNSVVNCTFIASKDNAFTAYTNVETDVIDDNINDAFFEKFGNSESGNSYRYSV